MSFISFLKYYIPITFALLNYLYFKVRVYYRKLEYKDPKTGKIINVHKLYDPFCSKDEFVYWKLILSGMFLFPFKFLTCISVIILCLISTNIAIHCLGCKNPEFNPKDRKLFSTIIKFWSGLFLKTAMIPLLKKNVNCEKVYKKYLGEDYDFSDQKYSAIICNHIGFFEVIVNMFLHCPGFIAKDPVSRYVLIGPIAKSLNCLFVNRENETARKQIMDKLYERQTNFLEGKSLAPLVLFPEGTTTSGRNILKFKKGAFYHLLPIKPEIICNYQESIVHLACGAQNVLFHTLRYLCFLTENLYIIEMPVIKPTKFMFDNYSSFGKEKWEVYAEVVRRIYCEVGGFKASDQGYRDSHKYALSMEEGVYNYVEGEKINS